MMSDNCPYLISMIPTPDLRMQTKGLPDGQFTATNFPQSAEDSQASLGGQAQFNPGYSYPDQPLGRQRLLEMCFDAVLLRLYTFYTRLKETSACRDIKCVETSLATHDVSPLRLAIPNLEYAGSSHECAVSASSPEAALREHIEQLSPAELLKLLENVVALSAFPDHILKFEAASSSSLKAIYQLLYANEIGDDYLRLQVSTAEPEGPNRNSELLKSLLVSSAIADDEFLKMIHDYITASQCVSRGQSRGEEYSSGSSQVLSDSANARTTPNKRKLSNSSYSDMVAHFEGEDSLSASEPQFGSTQTTVSTTELSNPTERSKVNLNSSSSSSASSLFPPQDQRGKPHCLDQPFLPFPYVDYDNASSDLKLSQHEDAFFPDQSDANNEEAQAATAAAYYNPLLLASSQLRQLAASPVSSQSYSSAPCDPPFSSVPEPPELIPETCPQSFQAFRKPSPLQLAETPPELPTILLSLMRKIQTLYQAIIAQSELHTNVLASLVENQIQLQRRRARARSIRKPRPKIRFFSYGVHNGSVVARPAQRKRRRRVSFNRGGSHDPAASSQTVQYADPISCVESNRSLHLEDTPQLALRQEAYDTDPEMASASPMEDASCPMDTNSPARDVVVDDNDSGTSPTDDAQTPFEDVLEEDCCVVLGEMKAESAEDITFWSTKSRAPTKVSGIQEQCLLQLEALAMATPHWARYSNSFNWHKRRLLLLDVDADQRSQLKPQRKEEYLRLFLDDSPSNDHHLHVHHHLHRHHRISFAHLGLANNSSSVNLIAAQGKPTSKRASKKNSAFPKDSSCKALTKDGDSATNDANIGEMHDHELFQFTPERDPALTPSQDPHQRMFFPAMRPPLRSKLKPGSLGSFPLLSQKVISFLSPFDRDGRLKDLWSLTSCNLCGFSSEDLADPACNPAETPSKTCQHACLRLKQASELIPQWTARLDAYRAQHDPSFRPLVVLLPFLQSSIFFQFISTYIPVAQKQLDAMMHSLLQSHQSTTEDSSFRPPHGSHDNDLNLHMFLGSPAEADPLTTQNQDCAQAGFEGTRFEDTQEAHVILDETEDTPTMLRRRGADCAGSSQSLVDHSEATAIAQTPDASMDGEESIVAPSSELMQDCGLSKECQSSHQTQLQENVVLGRVVGTSSMLESLATGQNSTSALRRHPPLLSKDALMPPYDPSPGSHSSQSNLNLTPSAQEASLPFQNGPETLPNKTSASQDGHSSSQSSHAYIPFPPLMLPGKGLGHFMPQNVFTYPQGGLIGSNLNPPYPNSVRHLQYGYSTPSSAPLYFSPKPLEGLPISYGHDFRSIGSQLSEPMASSDSLLSQPRLLLNGSGPRLDFFSSSACGTSRLTNPQALHPPGNYVKNMYNVMPGLGNPSPHGSPALPSPPHQMVNSGNDCGMMATGIDQQRSFPVQVRSSMMAKQSENPVDLAPQSESAYGATVNNQSGPLKSSANPRKMMIMICTAKPAAASNAVLLSREDLAEAPMTWDKPRSQNDIIQNPSLSSSSYSHSPNDMGMAQKEGGEGSQQTANQPQTDMSFVPIFASPIVTSTDCSPQADYTMISSNVTKRENLPSLQYSPCVSATAKRDRSIQDLMGAQMDPMMPRVDGLYGDLSKTNSFGIRSSFSLTPDIAHRDGTMYGSSATMCMDPKRLYGPHDQSMYLMKPKTEAMSQVTSPYMSMADSNAYKGEAGPESQQQDRAGIQGVAWNDEQDSWTAFWKDPITSEQQVRTFSVAQYGGKLARKMAVKCRRDADRQLNYAVKSRGQLKANSTSLKKDNHHLTRTTTSVDAYSPQNRNFTQLPKSEVPGVYWYRNRNGWVAQWFENGKNKHKFFAASVFGVEGAKQKAIAYRYMKLEEKRLKGW